MIMSAGQQTPPASAYLAGRLLTDCREVSHDLADLEKPGFWVVVGTFEGQWTLLRFADAQHAPEPAGHSWRGPAADTWVSSFTSSEYLAAVSEIRRRIALGEVYQVNLCRVLRAPETGTENIFGLGSRVAAGNPAPYLATISAPEVGIEIVSASPERYLSRRGRHVSSSPIKGTGRRRADLSEKDVAENVMIVDLVRNDLGQVCVPGTVVVEDLLDVETHPGLVHLVSTVGGTLSPGVTWQRLLNASFPPGSVSGAPKHTALLAIGELEPVPRGPYCGAIGWVEGDRGELAVGIRTFWRDSGELCFGTGAGITWGSDPAAEWEETKLKAQVLLGLASSRQPG